MGSFWNKKIQIVVVKIDIFVTFYPKLRGNLITTVWNLLY